MLVLNVKPTDQIQINAGIYNLFDKRIDTDTYDYVLDGRNVRTLV